MEIIITKCSMSLNWYYNHIGETYEVVEINKIDRDYTVFSGAHITQLVSFDDCDIFKCS